MRKGLDSAADPDDDDDGVGADAAPDDDGAAPAISPDPEEAQLPDPAAAPDSEPPSGDREQHEILSDIKAPEMLAEQGGAGASLPADNRGALARILRR